MAFHELQAAVAWLRTPQAIRARCNAVLAAAERDELIHFTLDLDRLDPTAQYVIETTRERYPDLNVPCHSRWRHFAAGGVDRWSRMSGRLAADAPEERARRRFDLAVISVLLDAGAGERWRYREPDGGRIYARSEGLAVASLRLFADGLFSAVSNDPLRADAAALTGLDERALAAGLQVGDANPLPGLAGRCTLLNRLGEALAAQPELFGMPPRAGNLFDYLAAQARDRRLSAPAVLTAVLRGFTTVWPGRITLGGIPVGDVGRHPAIRSDDQTQDLVPFHKLSQWLAYSLIEPLQEAGICVTELDGLTGLAEYRNGGLLVDFGVLHPKHAGVTSAAHAVDSEVIAEWRALTVALLDRLAGRVRSRLGVDAATLPLAQILEGGTWAAGRRIAFERRPDGAPPIQLLSDGTVF